MADSKPQGGGGGGGGAPKGGGGGPPPKKPGLFDKNSPLWLGIAAAVVCTFTATVLYLHKKMPKPPQGPDTSAHTIWSADFVKDYLRDQQSTRPAAPPPTPTAQERVLQEIPASARPRFEFYSMLPELSVDVPRQRQAPPPVQRIPPAPQPITPTASYRVSALQPQVVQQSAPVVVQSAPVVVQSAPRQVQQAAPSASGIYLQAGSFSNQRDANTQRATVLLQGLSARVQAVSVDGQPRYRVIIGPLDNQGYSRASDRLNRAGIAHFVAR